MQFGSYEVSVVSDGSYRLDGGSLFGIVPKVFWERWHPADESNRIELALNCLLVRGEGRVVLVDTGMGDGWTEKELGIYCLEREHGDVVAALQAQGVAPEDVTDVVLTHLHFDHVGGAVRTADGTPRLTFPNAVHWLQRSNLRWGEEPTERDRASYRRAKWELLLQDEDRLRLLDGPGEILPGIRTMVVNGHTPGQQLVHVGEGASSLLYCGDLIPLASHLRVPYIMSLDLNPLITLTEKKDILARAAAERWTLAFDHDPVVRACTVAVRDGRFEVDQVVDL